MFSVTPVVFVLAICFGLKSKVLVDDNYFCNVKTTHQINFLFLSVLRQVFVLMRAFLL